MALSNNDIKNLVNVPDKIISIHGEEIEHVDLNSNIYKAKFLTISDSKIESYVYLKDLNIQNGFIIENCEFFDIVGFDNVKVENYDTALNPNSQSVVFKNCVFHDKVNFINNNSFERTLLFEGCTFKKGIEIITLKIEVESLKFDKCTIYEKFDLNKIIIKQDLILISNEIHCRVRIEETTCNSLIILDDNIFYDLTHILFCYFTRGVIFNKGVFKDEVKFFVVKTEHVGLYIYGSIFEKAVFSEHHHHKNQPITGINKYYFTDAKFINGIYINGTNDLLADYSLVDEIILDISPELKGDIFFRNLDVGIIAMSGINSFSNIMFQDIFVNQIKINALINNAGLIFSRIKASYNEWFRDTEKTNQRQSAIYIDDSNFGKAQLFQVIFNSFEKVKFHNVILMDISTSLVKWFTPEQLDDGHEANFKTALTTAKKTKKNRIISQTLAKILPLERAYKFLEVKERDNINKFGKLVNSCKESLRYKIKNIATYLEEQKIKDFNDKRRINSAFFSLTAEYNSKKEIYRQLKFASQKQGDITQSLVFQRWEMDYYRKLVNLNSPTNWSEYFILLTSRTNDFNQNWIKALVFFLVFSFIFYIPIGFLTADYLDFTTINFSLDSIIFTIKSVCWDNLKIWIVLMNPTHRMSDIKENIQFYSSWIYFWDFLSRIVVSYFIFQIVSAFRKFNK